MGKRALHGGVHGLTCRAFPHGGRGRHEGLPPRRYGMVDAEHGMVECDGLRLEGRLRPVAMVPDDGMATMRGLEANLVRAASLEVHLEQRTIRFCFERLPAQYRALSFRVIGGDERRFATRLRHVVGPRADASQPPLDQDKVSFLNEPVAELCGEPTGRLCGAGQDRNSGRRPVEPMDGTKKGLAGVLREPLFPQRDDVSVSGVVWLGEHARRLVHDQKLIVEAQDVHGSTLFGTPLRGHDAADTVVVIGSGRVTERVPRGPLSSAIRDRAVGSPSGLPDGVFNFVTIGPKDCRPQPRTFRSVRSARLRRGTAEIIPLSKTAIVLKEGTVTGPP